MSKAAGKTREEVLAAALATLKAQPEIAAAFSAQERSAWPWIRSKPPDKRSVAARLKLSFVPGRSGDLLGALKPFITFDGPPYVVNHGSPWDYDRRVPLIFFGPWAAEQRSDPVAHRRPGAHAHERAGPQDHWSPSTAAPWR